MGIWFSTGFQLVDSYELLFVPHSIEYTNIFQFVGLNVLKNLVMIKYFINKVGSPRKKLAICSVGICPGVLTLLFFGHCTLLHDMRFLF